MKKGESVVLKHPFWYKGEDLGGRSGIIISNDAYVLINLSDYPHNPVKCFRNEISPLVSSTSNSDEDTEEMDWSDLLDSVLFD